MWLDNFNRLRERSGLSLDELSECSGIPKSTLSKISAGITKSPSIETIKSLVYSMGYTLADLDDSSPIADFSIEEFDHIKKYRALDEHGKEIVATVLECEYKRYSEQKKTSDPVIMLPVYDMWESPKIIYLPEPLQPAAAGYGDPADDETADMVPVRYNDATRKADYIMRVHGDSMEPELHDGDRVLVRSQPSVEIGQMGVFLDDGERVVKIYRGDHLESLNPEYPDLSFKGFSECKGLVIGILKPKWIAEE